MRSFSFTGSSCWHCVFKFSCLRRERTFYLFIVRRLWSFLLKKKPLFIFCLVYVCTCLCAHVYAGAWLHVCMSMWKSSTSSISQGSPSYLETGFLTEPGAHWLFSAVQIASPEILMTLPPSPEITDWLFIPLLVNQTQTFMLACQERPLHLSTAPLSYWAVPPTATKCWYDGSCVTPLCAKPCLCVCVL